MVVNAETGDVIENVTRIQMDVTQQRHLVTLTLFDPAIMAEFTLHSDTPLTFRARPQP
jgi:hypothetical protein